MSKLELTSNLSKWKHSRGDPAQSEPGQGTYINALGETNASHGCILGFETGLLVATPEFDFSAFFLVLAIGTTDIDARTLATSCSCPGRMLVSCFDDPGPVHLCFSVDNC